MKHETLPSPLMNLLPLSSFRPKKPTSFLQVHRNPQNTPFISLIYRIPTMASLPPPLPHPNLASQKLRTSVAASSAANPSQGQKATSDFVQEALMSADTKRPWWAPIFRIDGSDVDPQASERKRRDPATASNNSVAERPKRQSLRSGLTEEKARVLRKEMRAMESWHDPMYHSAIAARLASPDHS